MGKRRFGPRPRRPIQRLNERADCRMGQRFDPVGYGRTSLLCNSSLSTARLGIAMADIYIELHSYTVLYVPLARRRNRKRYQPSQLETFPKVDIPYRLLVPRKVHHEGSRDYRAV